MNVARQIEIAVPPQQVYEVIMNPRCLEEWVTIHVGLDDAPDGSLRQGSKLTQRLKLAGRCFTVKWTVVEDEPGRRVVWNGRGPLRSKAEVVYDLQPSEAGTLFCYQNEYALPGGPLGRMAGPMVNRVTAGELSESLQRLRSMLE